MNKIKNGVIGFTLKGTLNGALLFFLGSLQTYCFSQQSKIDSLLAVIEKDMTDSAKIANLNKVSGEYVNVSNYTKARYYADAAFQLASQKNYTKAISIYYNNSGIIYFKEGNYEKALENYLASLDIKEKMGDEKGLAVAFNNLAMVYNKQGDIDKALENYTKGLKIRKKIGDKPGISDSYNNLGVALGEKQKYGQAMENFFSALEIQKEVGNKYTTASIYNNLGMVYYYQNKYDKALINYRASLAIRSKIEDNYGMAVCYSNIGNVYRKLKQLQTALDYYNKSLNIHRGLNNTEEICENYQNLSGTYEDMADFKNAYLNYQHFSKTKDSVFKAISNKQMAELQIQYETEKQGKENAMLQQIGREREMEMDKQKRKKNIQIAGLSFILVFSAIIFLLIHYRNKLQQRALFEKEINLRQVQQFKAIIDAEEKERKRIAQELHDGLGQVLSVIKLNIMSVENTVADSDKIPFINSLSLIDNACNELREISHNMMPSVLIELGFIPSLREMLRKINQSGKLKATMEVDFDKRFDESAEITVYRIVQEIINNIIKHSEATAIALSLKKEECDLVIQVVDNGKQFELEALNKGTGIGWKNIHSRSALLNGVVKLGHGNPVGMTVNLYFSGIFPIT